MNHVALPALAKATCAETLGLEPANREHFLTAMRYVASTVSVVTTTAGEIRMGLTISSFLSVSADPPLVAICINRKSPVSDAITRSGALSVHVLAEHQSHIADTFAGRPRDGLPYDLASAEWLDDETGREPVLAGSAISLEAQVMQSHQAGSHTMFIAEVRHVVLGDRAPLLYWDRAYSAPVKIA